MEVKIKKGTEMIDATIEMIDGCMVVSPKVDKFEPKDGDVVAVGEGSQIFICRKYIDEGLIESYIGYDFVKNEVFPPDEWEVSRYATEEEREKLLNALKREGYEFDFDKKELVKLKWKPKLDEKYYSPFYNSAKSKFIPSYNIFTKHFTDELTINKWGAFRTESECQDFCDKLNQAVSSAKL